MLNSPVKFVHDMAFLSSKSFLFLCNVCCMFNFVHNDALSFYINTFLNSDCAVYSTRSVSSFKVQPIVRSRKADELCFQISAVSDWNSLPYNITMLTNFNEFKIKVIAFLFV